MDFIKSLLFIGCATTVVLSVKKAFDAFTETPEQ
jgi:hypothetical protein